jgi:hypothetical protein
LIGQFISWIYFATVHFLIKHSTETMPLCAGCHSLFRSEKGYHRHLSANEQCLRIVLQEGGHAVATANRSPEVASAVAMASGLRINTIESGRKRKDPPTEDDNEPCKVVAPSWFKLAANSSKMVAFGSKTTGLDSDSDDFNPEFLNEDDEQMIATAAPEEELNESEQELVETDATAMDNDTDEPDHNNDRVLIRDLNTTMNLSFRNYCSNIKQNHLPHLTKDQTRGIKLMNILVQKKSGFTRRIPSG